MTNHIVRQQGFPGALQLTVDELTLACAEQTKAELTRDLEQLCLVEENLKELIATINNVVPGLLSENGDLNKDRGILSNLWTWIKLVITGDMQKITDAFEKFHAETKKAQEEDNAVEEIATAPTSKSFVSDFLSIKTRVEDYTKAVFGKITTYATFYYEEIGPLAERHDVAQREATSLGQRVLDTTVAALPAITTIGATVGAVYLGIDSYPVVAAIGAVGGAIGGVISYGLGKLFGTANKVEAEENEAQDVQNAAQQIEAPRAMTLEESKAVIDEYFGGIDPEFAEFISKSFTFPEGMAVELSQDKKTLNIRGLPVVNPKVDTEATLTEEEFAVLDRRNIDDLKTLKSVKQNTKPMPEERKVKHLSYFGSIGEKATDSIKKGTTPMAIGPSITFTKKENGTLGITGGPEGINSVQFIKGTPGNGAVKINPDAWINDTYYLKDLQKLITILQ